MEPSTEEHTSPSTTAELTESTTEFFDVVTSKMFTTTEVYSSDSDTDKMPNSSSRPKREILHITALASSLVIWALRTLF